MKLSLVLAFIFVFLIAACGLPVQNTESNILLPAQTPVDSLYIKYQQVEKRRIRVKEINDSISQSRRVEVKKILELDSGYFDLSDENYPAHNFHKYAIEDKTWLTTEKVESLTIVEIFYNIFNDSSREIGISRANYEGGLNKNWPEPGAAILILNHKKDTLFQQTFHIGYFENLWGNKANRWDIINLQYIGMDKSQNHFRFRFSFGIYDACGFFWQDLKIDTKGEAVLGYFGSNDG